MIHLATLYCSDAGNRLAVASNPDKNDLREMDPNVKKYLLTAVR